MTVISELEAMNFVCKTEVLDSGHIIIGDEPEKFHGDNKGPNPFALLQTSLAH